MNMTNLCKNVRVMRSLYFVHGIGLLTPAMPNNKKALPPVRAQEAKPVYPL
ncbi:hypothetical protein [Paenibacillus harenae]|uniref:hypothetical protein n=1 Tax=Paenibacillus harenae TaxID=306543 RepID=UPI0012EB4362|nr:hypothetical protein [Paenibacillus harenae]